MIPLRDENISEYGGIPKQSVLKFIPVRGRKRFFVNLWGKAIILLKFIPVRNENNFRQINLSHYFEIYPRRGRKRHQPDNLKSLLIAG